MNAADCLARQPRGTDAEAIQQDLAGALTAAAARSNFAKATLPLASPSLDDLACPCRAAFVNDFGENLMTRYRAAARDAASASQRHYTPDLMGGDSFSRCKNELSPHCFFASRVIPRVRSVESAISQHSTMKSCK
jgi:hypothetical protein